MSDKSKAFVEHLAQRKQGDWDALLRVAADEVHPVDRAATRIWFSFWPLRLCEKLEQSADPEETAKELELDGDWELSGQIDSSIHFFFAARHWREIKGALLDHARKGSKEASLEEQAKSVAAQAASTASTDGSVLLGLSAAGLMMLRQVGYQAMEAKRDTPAEKVLQEKTPEKALKARRKKSGGMFDFLKGAAQEYRVIWDETRRKEARFKVREGQDISWAAAPEGDFTSIDPRRAEGPIPAQCRSAACGYCWVGILSGAENIEELSDFELRRMRYFGYHSREADPGSHPLIRLSCQSKCHGDVTLVVPPWNGVIDGVR